MSTQDKRSGMESKYKKALAEKVNLQRELQLLEESMSSKQASEKIIQAIADKKDPIWAPDNIWQTSTNNPCCCVM